MIAEKDTSISHLQETINKLKEIISDRDKDIDKVSNELSKLKDNIRPHHYTRVARVDNIHYNPNDFFQNQYLSLNPDGKFMDDIDIKNIVTHNNIKRSEKDIRAVIVVSDDDNNKNNTSIKTVKTIWKKVADKDIKLAMQRFDQLETSCEQQRELLDIAMPCFNTLFDINSNKKDRVKQLEKILGLKNYGYGFILKTIK